jgi:hypothetical protein
MNWEKVNTNIIVFMKNSYIYDIIDKRNKMIQLLKKLFKNKEPEYCAHDWEILDPEKLPYKIRGSSISVCPDCAVHSSLAQMGSGIKLNEDAINHLKKNCPDLFNQK